MSTTEAIDSLYKLMNRDIPFEQKAKEALTIGERYLDVDNGHLSEIHPESEYWKAIESTDPPDGDFPPGLVLDLQTTYCRRVVDRQESIRLHNAPEQGWETDPAFEEHDIHCYHGSPLKVDEETYGTVCFVSQTPRQEPFTDEETMFAELIARLLEHELRRKRTEKEIERLEQFASVLSHDIRNPLSVAVSRVELAQTEHESDHLVEAGDALDRIDQIISDVLTMARQGQTIEETDEIRLSAIAQDCWETVAGKKASVTVDGDLLFRAAEDRLRHLFENLYRNAIEHGGNDVSIRVGPLADSDGFYVADDGPGIPEDERETVLEPEYTTGDGALGLGLTIVQSVAAAHDWEVEITTSETGGARFEFRNVIISELIED